MSSFRCERLFRVLIPATILMQVGACDPVAFNEFLQTVFLGITAAGSIAILRNI